MYNLKYPMQLMLYETISFLQWGKNIDISYNHEGKSRHLQ
jgi:hypothetical protein